MFYTKYSISLAITILNIFLFRKDSIFSPFKFMIIINTLYILFPLTLFGIFDYNIEVFGNIFPSLFSDSTNSYMLNMYICFNIIILLVRFLFQKNKVNFYFIL
ncbi:hypothetical protein GC56T2_3289 [Geobacillus sp. C56-T2]|nr:hypothetical protein GC56T2_3289 [Geobacillus sp. C56-T2]